MINILRSIPWAFRMTLHTAPVPFLTAVCTTLLLTFMPSAQVVLVNAAVGSVASGDTAASLTWAAVIGVLVAAYLLLQRASTSLFTMTKARVNAAAHQKLNTTLARVNPEVMSEPGMQKHLRAARESLTKQEIPTQANSVVTLCAAVAMVLLLCATIAGTSLPAAFFVAGCMVPLSAAMVLLAKRDYRIYGQVYEDRREEAYFLDALTHPSTAREIATLGAGGFFADGVARARDRATGREYHLEAVRGIVVGFSGLICSVLLMGALYCLISSGASAGEIAGALVGTLTCIAATQDVGYAFGQVSNGAMSIAQYRAFVDNPRYVLASETTHHNPPATGDSPRELTVRSLSVTYPGVDAPTLHQVNLHIQRGQMVALVGASGAGKTTLVRGILGLTPTTAGSVLFDDTPVDSLSVQQVFKHTTLLSQDYGRYELTVRENLLLGTHAQGQEPPTDQRLWDALSKARAAEFVQALPAGLDTQLGEQWGGAGLSGGQWQRLALARLILRNTALWILDEPTSAIDAHAEEEIFATLRKVAADHMTILVSHRAWTLKHADVIHVVDRGTIVESGTYAELLGAGGRFAEIFASQIEDAPEHTPSNLPVADGAESADDTGFTKEGAPSC